MDRKDESRKAEYESAIGGRVVRHSFEVDQPEHKRERNGKSDEAAPHNEPVSHTGALAPAEDETVKGEISNDPLKPVRKISNQMLGPKEDLPAALPVESRRRSLKPHSIAVSDTESGE